MPRAAKVERRPLGEQVHEIMRRLVVEGEFTPGQRLVEEQLAQRIGTSRTPIREALHRLEQEGLLERRKRGGFRVRPITAQEVEETTGVRAALESYALELAADRMGPADLDRMKANVREFESALEARDRKRLVRLNTDFHESIYRLSGSQLLARMLSDLSENLFRFRVALLADPDLAARSLEEHRAMLTALEEGRAAEAVAACRDHVLAGGQWIIQHLHSLEEES